MGRSPSCSTKKGPWTIDEDEKLKVFITLNGIGNWQRVPENCGIARRGNSCRLRWNNYLRPDIKRGHFTSSEEQKITQLHTLVGNKWAFIASHLPMRTGNEIQNYWNTVLKKRQENQGPSTHRMLKKEAVRAKAKPALAEPTASRTTPSSMKSRRGQQSTHVASSHRVRSHLAEWASVRLEAEARLLREAKMRPKLGARPPSVTTVGVHQHLASPMQILSDQTVNLPPLPNHIARYELEPLPFIHKPTHVDETGALLEISSPSSGRPQTGQLAGDHCISPLLDLEDFLFGQALLSAVQDDPTTPQLNHPNSTQLNRLAGDNYHIHPAESLLLTLSGAQSQEVLGSSMCKDFLILVTHDDGSDSALHTSVADCCLQVNDDA